ncbi:hypothetical protein [Stutzerimonas balearica]|uniref:hypothetical protein n=1 Tax=Stutzerimonas balearica TaxID=74829 RepID=UPI0028AD5C98|nr:hypothetical protein [Stutzerimonas balearica]
MAAISNSIVHLTMRFGSTDLAIGTGVLYGRKEQLFIVTAWHNVTGLHPETMRHLSKEGGVPDNIVATIAISAEQGSAGSGIARLPVVLPLQDEEKSLFYIHPRNWPRVDVVAIPLDPKAVHTIEMHLSTGELHTIEMPLAALNSLGLSTAICPIQNYLLPNEDVAQNWLDTVGVTEELFIPGYPHNVQDYYSQPVWKRATVASSVQLGWNRERKFLIDSASKSGMSGSPVLYYNSNGEVRIKGSIYHFGQDAAILAGIYVGRLGVTKESDPQIGTVWHRSVIDEIIDGGCFERLPFEIELSPRDLDTAAMEAFGTISRKGLDNVKNPEMPSRFYVRNRLLEQINGRASPERALEAVLAAAELFNGPFAPDEDN